MFDKGFKLDDITPCDDLFFKLTICGGLPVLSRVPISGGQCNHLIM